MTDRDIRAVHRLLKGNYSLNVVIMPTPTCILFRGVPLRFGPGWVRMRQETFPCHQPEDVIKALLESGLIRQRAADFLIAQLPFHINKTI